MGKWELQAWGSGRDIMLDCRHCGRGRKGRGASRTPLCGERGCCSFRRRGGLGRERGRPPRASSPGAHPSARQNAPIRAEQSPFTEHDQYFF